LLIPTATIVTTDKEFPLLPFATISEKGTNLDEVRNNPVPPPPDMVALPRVSPVNNVPLQPHIVVTPPVRPVPPNYDPPNIYAIVSTNHEYNWHA